MTREYKLKSCYDSVFNSRPPSHIAAPYRCAAARAVDRNAGPRDSLGFRAPARNRASVIDYYQWATQ